MSYWEKDNQYWETLDLNTVPKQVKEYHKQKIKAAEDKIAKEIQVNKDKYGYYDDNGKWRGPKKYPGISDTGPVFVNVYKDYEPKKKKKKIKKKSKVKRAPKLKKSTAPVPDVDRIFEREI